MTTNKTLFLYTESSLHAGIGSGTGNIDLPVQRERITGYPIIQGSGLKGALRSQYPQNDSNTLEAVFGPDTGSASEHAGAISVGDARMLAFPVRALKGVFVWVTAVDVLARFQRDCGKVTANLPAAPAAGQALIASKNILLDGTQEIVLEEYQYAAQVNTETAQWADELAKLIFPNTGIYQSYYSKAFKERFVVLPSEDFRDFVLYTTEIETRIKLNQATKTVDGTALFTQEALPSDCVMYAPIVAHKPRIEKQKGSFTEKSPSSDVSKWLDAHLPARIQVGGDETIGYGFCSVKWG